MKFWDSSAVIPLLVPEMMSGSLQKIFADDPVILAWWATEIECTSAIARQQRMGQLEEEVADEAFKRLRALRDGWNEIEPGDGIRESAKRFLRVHDLRTADALQLAAAFFAAEGHPHSLEFLSSDERLLTAAQREGFLTIKTAI